MMSFCTIMEVILVQKQTLTLCFCYFQIYPWRFQQNFKLENQSLETHKFVDLKVKNKITCNNFDEKFALIKYIAPSIDLKQSVIANLKILGKISKQGNNREILGKSRVYVRVSPGFDNEFH